MVSRKWFKKAIKKIFGDKIKVEKKFRYNPETKKFDIETKEEVWIVEPFGNEVVSIDLTGKKPDIVMTTFDIEHITPSGESYVRDKTTKFSMYGFLEYLEETGKYPIMEKVWEMDGNLGHFLEGGLADDKNIEDFDREQLEKGINVEMEHTDNRILALEIAMDHLVEHPKYYDYLEKMEQKMEADLELKEKKQKKKNIEEATYLSLFEEL